MALDKAPELYKDSDTAEKAIVEALNEGYLTLFIGAGVSKSATSLFPSWPELAKKCCDKAGVTFDDSESASNKYIRGMIQDVEDQLPKSEFIETVKEYLYEGVSSLCANESETPTP